MRQKLQDLMNVRLQIAQNKATMNKILIEAKKSLLYQEALKFVSDFKPVVTSLENEIRTATIEQFLLTENKHPWPGANIREKLVVEYSLDKKTLQWIHANMPIVLKVDEIMFADMIKTLFKKGGSLPEFIQLELRPSGTISANLSKEFSKEKKDEINHNKNTN